MNFVRFILWGTIISTVVLMAFGSATAALGACLGCPDWPLCYGSLLPPEQKFAVLEYTHRALAALTSFFVVGATVLSVKRYKGSFLLSAGIWLAIFLVAQILIGGLTVILKMPFWVSISHALFAQLTLLTAVTMLKWSENPPKSFVWAKDRDGRLSQIIFALLFFQVLLGAVIRKAQAGFACGQDVFLCLGSPWTGEVLLQVFHRLTGYLIFFTSLYALFSGQNKLWFTLVSVLILIVGIFGALSAYSMLSPTMVTTHYTLATLALILTFWRSVE